MPDISVTQENREGISEHTLSFNGDAGMLDRICSVMSEDGCLQFGCAKGQSRHIRPSENYIYSWLYGRHDHVIISGTTCYLQMISIRTHIGILQELGQEIVYVDCVRREERTEPWSRLSLKHGPVQPFTHTQAKRFMNRGNSHSVKRIGTPILVFLSGVLYAKHDHTPD